MEFFPFVTLLSDIQRAVNDRPLTYKSSEVDEPAIVTPNSFLKLNPTKEVNFGSLQGTELVSYTRDDLLLTLNRRDELFEAFKNKFYEDYLISLRETSRQLYQDKWSESLRQGDVVLLYNPVKPRVMWPLGVITELLTGDDGKTRCVRVKKSNTEEVHSVSHIYPLEISLQNVRPPKQTTEPLQASRRPKRKAALDCVKRMKNLD